MLQSSFSLIDQLMAGQLWSTAVSGVEVAGCPAFIYSVVLGATATIAGIMISQYLGMNDKEMADRSHKRSVPGGGNPYGKTPGSKGI